MRPRRLHLPLHTALLVFLASALFAGAVAVSTRAAPINGKATRERIRHMFRHDLRDQQELHGFHIGRGVSPASERKAVQTYFGFRAQGADSNVYAYPYRTGSGKLRYLVVTVTDRYVPAMAAPGTAPARYFVARDGQSGDVVGRGHVAKDGTFVWTRGRNGHGPAERNLAR